MEEKIEKYLREEKKIKSEVVRERLVRKVLKYEDIAAEFYGWLEARNYAESKLEINGYKAVDIYVMAPMLDGIGVYNFMVTLRDNPEEASAIVRDGFRVL